MVNINSTSTFLFRKLNGVPSVSLKPVWVSAAVSSLLIVGDGHSMTDKLICLEKCNRNFLDSVHTEASLCWCCFLRRCYQQIVFLRRSACVHICRPGRPWLPRAGSYQQDPRAAACGYSEGKICSISPICHCLPAGDLETVSADFI